MYFDKMKWYIIVSQVMLDAIEKGYKLPFEIRNKASMYVHYIYILTTST